MRIQLIAIGSTGDVQPMVVLGRALAARGHEVSVTAFEALQGLVEDAGLGYRSLPGDAVAYIGKIIQPGANPLSFLIRLKDVLNVHGDAFLAALYQACEEADAIVTTFFGATLYAFAAHLGKPLFQSNYCLTDMTGRHCLPIIKQPPLGQGFNRLTYRLAYRMIGFMEARYIVPWCRAHGIKPRLMSGGPDYSLPGWSVPVLYAFSERVVERPPEWAENIHIVGFWEDVREGGEIPESLAQFLKEPGETVYIGFGSMTSGDMGKTLDIVLSALEKTGLRAVLSAGWGGLDGANLPDSVHVLRSFVPHRLLFESVDAVIHHGGAGTTAAGLMAGRPTLVIPFGSDQFFWGDRVRALGCGPEPIPREKLTADNLAVAMRGLIRDQAYAQHARQVGLRLSGENGQERAADLIEQHLRKWDWGAPGRY